MKMETTLITSHSQLKTANEVFTFIENLCGDSVDASSLLSHLANDNPNTFPYKGGEVNVKYEDDEKTALQEEYKILKKNFDVFCDYFERCESCPLRNELCYRIIIKK